MKKLNVGFILRKAAMASTPVMTIAEVHGCPHLSFDFYLEMSSYAAHEQKPALNAKFL